MELLERDLFLQKLDLLLNEAIAGQGQVALVSGEAGIGKTSLVEHFTRAHEGSVRVLRGACDELFTPRPLGPLHDIAIDAGGELMMLLKSNGERQAIFSACLAELQNRPTILVFEDVHWADETTLDLIKLLGRRIQRTGTLFILTYRDDELSTEHPLRLVLGDLPRLVATHLQLLPLSQSSVLALASAADRKKQAIELFAITGGNPFFVTEALASQSGGIPSTVRDAVLARAGRLSPGARALLEAAAVIGLRIEPWLLSNIIGLDSTSVEECVARGMLQVQGDDYAFRHELARQTILETISPERRLALHRMILSVLKESPETHNDLARLANHAVGTKDISAVLEYAPAAAQQASAASSHREAITLYELALRFADSLPPARHAQMLEAYHTELQFAPQLDEAAIALKKAIELRHSIGDYLKEGQDLGDLGIDSYLIGRKAEAEQASQSAIVTLEALPPSVELGRAYNSQCFIRYENRDCAEAVTWGEKALALAEQFDDKETAARACNYAGSSLLIMDYERGTALMERSLKIGREANLPFTIAGTFANFSQALVELYHFDAAKPYLTEGIAYATEHDDDYHLQEMLTWQALVRLHQGQWAEANEILLKVLGSPNLDPYNHNYALLALGCLRVRQGDSTAPAVLDEALALSIQADAIVRLGYARAARAEMAWLANDPDRAIEEARAVYEVAVNKEHPWIAGELAFWCWKAGDPVRPPSWIAQPFALQIAGDWRASVKEWEQRGCPYEQALALKDGDASAQLAALEIFERLGARPAMEKLKQEMRSKGVRGIPRGPRPATRENPYGLTAREVEVLASLVDGSNNNAIAKKLSLSTRTVEHHIASILQKMNVTSRNEAVALALKEKLLPFE